MLYLRVFSHLNSLTREPGIWEMAAPAHAAKHKTMAAALNAFKAELTVKAKGPAPNCQSRSSYPKSMTRQGMDQQLPGDPSATGIRLAPAGALEVLVATGSANGFAKSSRGMA